MARTRKVLAERNGPKAGRKSDPGPGARRRGPPGKKVVELDSEGEELMNFSDSSSDAKPAARPSADGCVSFCQLHVNIQTGLNAYQ